MTEKRVFSSTMRIDLIPDVPSRPEGPGDRLPFLKPVGGQQRRSAGASAGRQASSHYERLLQSLYDAAIVSNLSGRILDANVRAGEFLKYSREALCGLHVFDVVMGADDKLLDTVCENLTNERHTLIQAFCLRSDQSYFPAEIAVTLLNLDQECLCFFIRDITLRRQAEEMLMTEHSAIRNSANGIAITDLAGVVQYANPAAEQLWGIVEEQGLLGEALSGLVAGGAGALEALLAELKAEGDGAVSGEFAAAGKDGVSRDVRLSGARNRNAEGEIVGFIFSIEDIRDRKRAEQAERESQRRRVMIESLGAACHHLGQPSTVLLGNLELLKERLGQDGGEVCHMLESSLKSMEQIVNVLGRLSAVDEYRTREYLPNTPSGGEAVSILEI